MDKGELGKKFGLETGPDGAFKPIGPKDMKKGHTFETDEDTGHVWLAVEPNADLPENVLGIVEEYVELYAQPQTFRKIKSGHGLTFMACVTRENEFVLRDKVGSVTSITHHTHEGDREPPEDFTP